MDNFLPGDKKIVLDVWCSAEKFGAFFEALKAEKLASKEAGLNHGIEEVHARWKDAVPPSGMRPIGAKFGKEVDEFSMRFHAQSSEEWDEPPEETRRRVLAYADRNAHFRANWPATASE